jgi:SAM-dependent methyltransferase
MDWDTYWRWELHRRASDPVDFRRWKADSSRELRQLYPGDGVRVLDSTCGLGDHTVVQAELGFAVEACDRSELALGATAQAARAAHVDVELFRAEWATLGAARPARYDLVFNDALHWIYDPGELDGALRGLNGALKPGGALVFFFADESDGEPGAGARQLAAEEIAPARVAWDVTACGRRVVLTIVNERGEDFVDAHHVYTVTEATGEARVEALTQRQVYRWDWHALAPRLVAAGFERLTTRHFENVKGRMYAMSFAWRSR